MPNNKLSPETFHQSLHNILKPETPGRILLAVSGGIDSVAMAWLFHQIGFDFGIAHCNFQLRETESDDDEAFTAHLAQRFNVPFFAEKFETNQHASLQGISIQMAARNLRYEWFEKIRSQHDFQWIAIAHNKDDNIETILLNIIRGTGLNGLEGIQNRRNRIIRPMLTVSRNKIVEYVQANSITYREDSSNLTVKYSRNKIRHQLLPLMHEINPASGDNILRMADIAAEANGMITDFMASNRENFIQQNEKEAIIYLENIDNYPYRKLILYELLRDFNFSPSVILSLASLTNYQTGKTFFSPTHICLIDRGKLIVSQHHEEDSPDSYQIKEPDEIIHTPEGTFELTLHDAKTTSFNHANEYQADIDFHQITFPLVLRHPEAGDSFHPLGMSGKKKVSDYLTDKKIPLTQKRQVWILCDATGQIIWIAGYRIDERFKISNATQQILKINFFVE